MQDLTEDTLVHVIESRFYDALAHDAAFQAQCVAAAQLLAPPIVL